MREKTKADLVAEHMLGKDWFRSVDVRKFLGTSSPHAIQVTQQIRTFKKYRTVEKKEGSAVFIRVLEITYESPAAYVNPTRERKLWRLAIFGTPLKEHV